MIELVPKELFLTKGVGKHREKLTSFELALRSAGIAACNLVRVSSIFPPCCPGTRSGVYSITWNWTRVKAEGIGFREDFDHVGPPGSTYFDRVVGIYR